MIHKTNKEEGKKHITMPLRWEFRLFQPNSRPISTCFYCFGRWPTQPDSGWISLVRRKSKPNRCKSGRVGANLRKKKKKEAQTQHRHAGNRVGLKCGTLPATSVLSRLSQQRQYKKITQLDNAWIEACNYTLFDSILIYDICKPVLSTLDTAKSVNKYVKSSE